MDEMSKEALEYLKRFVRSKDITEEQALELKIVRGIMTEMSGRVFNWNDTKESKWEEVE